MAITIEQQPDVGIYASGGQHIYIASSDETDRQQHTIQAEVYKGNTRVATFNKPLNAQSAAVFDFGPIFDANLRIDNTWFDISSWDNTNFQTIDDQQSLFEVHFNEKWLEGDEVSVQNTNDVESNQIRVIKGGVDYYDTDTRLSTSVDGPAMLTFGYSDKVEINGTQEMFVICYGENFVVNAREVDGTDNHNIVTLSDTTDAGLYLVRCGIDVAHINEFEHDNYTVRLEDSDSNLIDDVEIELVEDNEIDNTTTVRWFERGWREFDFTRAHSKQTRVNTKDYRRSPLGFNGNTYDKVNDNIFANGRTKYYSRFDTTYTVATRWLSEETMDYLDSLYSSTDVYVKDGDNWIPIIITSNSFQGFRDNRNSELQSRMITYKRGVNRELR